jgi:hypothetical protein
VLGHTGFESDGGTRGDVEPVAVRRVAVELQRGVGLRQVHMAADLHRAITRIDHIERQSRSAPALIAMSPSP